MSRIHFPDRVSYDQIICPYCWVNTNENHMNFVEGIGMVCKQCIKANRLTPKVFADPDCFHECPQCNTRCNCSTQPCSHCEQGEEAKP